jgi:hypothetical protein
MAVSQLKPDIRICDLYVAVAHQPVAAFVSRQRLQNLPVAILQPKTVSRAGS